MSDDLIYLFTGTAEIFIKNRMKRIIQGYNKKNYTVIKYDMESTSFTRVINDAITIPFLEDLKIIILKNPQFLTIDKENLAPDYKDFIKYLKNPIETTIIMIDATNIKMASSNEIFKTLKMVANIITYEDTQEVEIKGWVIRTLASNNIEIKEDALTIFMKYLNNDQIRMEQELEKLMAYVGIGGQITTATVKLLVNKDLSKEIYNLTKALVEHNRPQVCAIYEELSHNTRDILGIIGLLNSTFVRLLTTAKFLKLGYSQNDIAKFYNISPGRAFYLVQDARAFKLADLERYVKRMAEFDYKLKSGQIDKNIGMDILILQF